MSATSHSPDAPDGGDPPSVQAEQGPIYPHEPVLSQGHTYETAAARLEEIIGRLDSGEASLAETLRLVTEGRDLIEFCAVELEAVGQSLQQLRLDELVTRLGSDTTG